MLNINLFTILGLKNRIKGFFRLSVARQPYFVGKIEERQLTNPKAIYLKLIRAGYQWNYFSYYDKDEIINVRKLHSNRQVHIRIFKDGEVRMHDELNYEFDMVGHLKAMTFRKAEDETIKEILSLLEIRQCASRDF